VLVFIIDIYSGLRREIEWLWFFRVDSNIRYKQHTE